MQARTFSLSTVKLVSIATESITGRSTRLGESSVFPAISRVPLARARQMAHATFKIQANEQTNSHLRIHFSKYI